MDEEDNKALKPQFVPGQNLDNLSVEDLEAIISLLQEEIARLENARAKKQDHLSAAQAIFAKK